MSSRRGRTARQEKQESSNGPLDLDTISKQLDKIEKTLNGVIKKNLASIREDIDILDQKVSALTIDIINEEDDDDEEEEDEEEDED